MIRYAIFLEKVPGRDTPRASIDAHVAHLRALDEAGKLVLCGPFTDHASGLVVVHARDKAEAEAIAAADPFVRDGVRTFTVRTWQLANRENNYLG